MASDEDTAATEREEPPTGRDVHNRDWECRDCGDVYCADEDSGTYDLPDNCPSCGDTPGWINRKTGRIVP